MESYIVSSYSKEFYCETQRYTNTTASIFSFGDDISICVKEEAYIDTIESNPNNLHTIKAALWTFHQLYPAIERLNLRDETNTYDSILSCGKTWYEDKFQAKLPEPLFTQYQESLKHLDEPLDSFAFQSERMPNLKQYEEFYSKAKSPRDFINSLRTQKNYCDVGTWLTQYMEMLRIRMFKDSWYIETSSLEEPTGFSVKHTNELEYKRTRKQRNHTEEKFSIVT